MACCELENYPEEYDSNQEQEDEVTALKSIYDEKLSVISCPNAEKLYMIQVDVEILLDESGITVEAFMPYEGEDSNPCEASNILPTTKRPDYQRSVSGKRWTAVFQLSHLLPLTIQVTFPRSYPSKDSPIFTISCLWLSASQLSKVCKQLDEIWVGQQGMPVVFTWVDWLQNNLLSFLGVEDKIIMVEHNLEDLVHEFESRDPRALPLGSSVSFDLIQLFSYNLQREWEEFQHKDQECGICFEILPGTEFFKLPDCCHVCCQDCMSAYVELHVTEGTVQQLRCPHDKCKTGLPHEIIQGVLGEEAYSRWEKLVLDRAIENLGDVVWCPRCQEAGARQDNLAQCSACNFSFCILCEETWHGGTSCMSIEQQMEQIRREAGDLVKSMKKRGRKKKDQANLDDSDEDEIMSSLENSPTKRALARKMADLRKEYLSKSMIKSTCKKCPHCHINIFKFTGCNKVQCSQCGNSMCWKCGKAIKGYGHFSSSSCHLFPGQEMLMPQHLANRPVNHEAQRINAVVRGAQGDQQVMRQLARCPTCRQRCLKEGRNNHLRCWQCKTNFCFMCKEKIDGTLASHYMVASPCVQHSDD